MWEQLDHATECTKTDKIVLREHSIALQHFALNMDDEQHSLNYRFKPDLFFVCFLAVVHGLWDFSSQIQDQTCTPCSGTTKSQPLDHQGSPSSQIFVFCISVFLFFPRNVSLFLEKTCISVVGLIFQHSLCHYLDGLPVRNEAVLIWVLVLVLPFCVLGLGTQRGRV